MLFLLQIRITTIGACNLMLRVAQDDTVQSFLGQIDTVALERNACLTGACGLLVGYRLVAKHAASPKEQALKAKS